MLNVQQSPGQGQNCAFKPATKAGAKERINDKFGTTYSVGPCRLHIAFSSCDVMGGVAFEPVSFAN